MTSDTGERWLITLAGIATLCLGVWVGFQESAQNFRGGSTPIMQLLSMPDGNAPIGLSILSQRNPLMDCEVALRSDQSLELAYLSPEEATRIVPLCSDIAAQVTSRTPAMSLAWLVAAAAAARSGDMQSFNDDLVRSQITAPNEQWLARLRLRQADANLAQLGPEAVTGYEGDLRVLAFDPVEIWVLVRRYIADQQFRPYMQAALETMPSAIQAQFLQNVSQMLSSEGR